MDTEQIKQACKNGGVATVKSVFFADKTANLKTQIREYIQETGAGIEDPEDMFYLVDNFLPQIDELFTEAMGRDFTDKSLHESIFSELDDNGKSVFYGGGVVSYQNDMEFDFRGLENDKDCQYPLSAVIIDPVKNQTLRLVVSYQQVVERLLDDNLSDFPHNLETLLLLVGNGVDGNTVYMSAK